LPRALPNDTWNNLYYPPPDYEYFIGAAQSDFEPEAIDFSKNNACWLADAALLAYVKDWNVVTRALRQAKFDDFQAIGTDPGVSTKGFIAKRLAPTPFLIVAFRGTDRDDPRNLATDESVGPSECDGCMVHTGFRTALDQVWTTEVDVTLRRFVETCPQGWVYFTGHSLGAALATIAVTRFQGANCALYTIGSPRVGDDRFCRKVASRTKQVFRFVNCQDIVTLIPLEVPMAHYFHHVGVEKYIDRKGQIHDHPSELVRGLDAAQGIMEHDGLAALAAVTHPKEYLSSALRNRALGDPPPYLLGNHTPSRYATILWGRYFGM
jgi:triacylglycerol lipase